MRERGRERVRERERERERESEREREREQDIIKESLLRMKLQSFHKAFIRTNKVMVLQLIFRTLVQGLKGSPQAIKLLHKQFS